MRFIFVLFTLQKWDVAFSSLHPAFLTEQLTVEIPPSELNLINVSRLLKRLRNSYATNYLFPIDRQSLLESFFGGSSRGAQRLVYP